MNMNRFLERVARAPSDGGGGAEGQTGGAPQAAAAAQPGGAATSAQNDPPPQGGVAQPYFPQGISDNYKGASDRETIDRMAQGLESYRKKAGDVPRDVAGYRDFGEIAEPLKPYYSSLEGDDFFDKLGERALARKMPKGEYQAMVKDFFELAAERNMLEPPLDPKAEIAALVPDHAKNLSEAEQKTAVDKRMADNQAWLESLKAQGMPAESADFMTLMLSDSAKGHKAIEYVRSRMEGTHRPAPGGGNGDGSPAGQGRIDQIKAQLNEPKHIPGKPGYDARAHEALIEELKRLAPSN